MRLFSRCALVLAMLLSISALALYAAPLHSPQATTAKTAWTAALMDSPSFTVPSMNANSFVMTTIDNSAMRSAAQGLHPLWRSPSARNLAAYIDSLRPYTHAVASLSMSIVTNHRQSPAPCNNCSVISASTPAATNFSALTYEDFTRLHVAIPALL